LPVALIERSAWADRLFHSTILEAARNPIAAHFIENLHIMRLAVPINEARDRATRIEEHARTDREHQAILAALRSGDGAADYQQMLVHLQNTRKHLPSEFLSQLPGGPGRDGAPAKPRARVSRPRPMTNSQ